MQREQMLEDAQDKLLGRVRNYELNKQYKAAVDLIEKDEDFRKYKAEMPRVRKKLDELKALLKEQ
jgi:hypothetical protein